MKITFSTTLKCSGCVAKVKPLLDEMKQIKSWQVDLQSNPKTLTVEGDNLNANEIIAKVAQAGYQAVQI